ncbi:MAG: glycosyltransferase family 39 protein, partial [Candidatus Latescibacterota bacterium]
MAKKAKKKVKQRWIPPDWFVYLLLLLVSVLVRLPFLGTFDLVAYDGVYYINQAKGFLGNPHLGGAFPIGYPVFIALLLPVVGDGVRAAQIISFAAGVGTLFVFFALGKRLVSKNLAIIVSFVLALTPIFIRLSMMTLSESIFVFWLFLGLLFFYLRKDLSFGLSMGMAAITRPE